MERHAWICVVELGFRSREEGDWKGGCRSLGIWEDGGGGMLL